MITIDHLELYSVAIITCLAVISPGPDFAMVSRMSLLKGRKEGILCALGISMAIAVHLTYTLLGLGILFANNLWVLNTLRYLGALYLVWLGLSALWPDIKRLFITSTPPSASKPTSAELAVNNSSFWMGFACNALNPKTLLFIVSLFSQVISPNTSVVMELGYGVYIAFAHFLWFGFVACLLTSAPIQHKITACKLWIERLTGVLLATLGVCLLDS